MKKLRNFFYDLLISRYLLFKQKERRKKIDQNKIGHKLLAFSCNCFFGKAKKFIDDFFVASFVDPNFPFFRSDNVKNFLLLNKDFLVDRNTLKTIAEEILPHYCSRESMLYIMEHMKLQINREVAIVILEKTFLQFEYHLEVHSWSDTEFEIFKFCIPYLTIPDQKHLLEEILKISESIFSEGSDWEDFCKSTIGPGLTEPIKYLSRAIFNKEGLEKCADFMVYSEDRGSYNYLQDMHEIVTLYLEAATNTAFEKILAFGEKVGSYGDEDWEAFGKYCFFLVRDVAPVLVPQ